jgi:hypothetical protein
LSLSHTKQGALRKREQNKTKKHAPPSACLPRPKQFTLRRREQPRQKKTSSSKATTLVKDGSPILIAWRARSLSIPSFSPQAPPLEKRLVSFFSATVYWTSETVLENDVQLVVAAFGRIKIFEGAARTVLKEPFALKATRNYFREKDPSLGHKLV